MDNARTAPGTAAGSLGPADLLPSDASPAPSGVRQWFTSLARGHATDPAWIRPALFALLSATAVVYLWNLAASGWANAYYSAAVQAGTKSWKAFFFGSLDASNFITVDKTPAGLWVMEISARLFGLSAWSVLVPQALEGVATVAIIYIAVRRWFGPAAGLVAGGVVALTPVATLMFRYNTPDALLALLLTAAAYATLRAIENGHTPWLILAGVLVGAGFLTKELQAFVIVPVLGGVYLLAGRPPLWRRFRQMLLAAGSMIVASGWWVLAVVLVPSASRPYIGGSPDNSLISVILGYNGLGRLTGNEPGSVGGFGPIGSRWGLTGWSRLFNGQFGGQVSWLIPGALILLAISLMMMTRQPRTDIARAARLTWGGSLLLTGAVFSFAEGIIHPYYTVALAPSIGALVGMGGSYLWARRSELTARLALSGTVATTAHWSFILLTRSPDFLPLLRVAVLVVGLACAFLILDINSLSRVAQAALATVALGAALAGPAAYSIYTASTPHSGAIPSAGPLTAALFDGRGFTGVGPGRGLGPGAPGGGFPRAGVPALPGGGFPGAGTPTLPGGGFGRVGPGFLSSSQPIAQLVTLLDANAGQYTWVAATVNANSAAGYQLATGDPVMAIGGFNGTDPAPTLEQFQQYVGSGRIHYFIAGRGGLGSGGAGTTAAEITAWVQSNFSAMTVGSVTVYDLTSTTSA